MTSATVTATDTSNDAVKYALERVGKAGMVLKSKQVEAIRCVYEEKDVLPTGFGKTICFEVLPFLFDYKHGKVGNTSTATGRGSVVVVVSPLVSLMGLGLQLTIAWSECSSHDQAQQCRESSSDRRQKSGSRQLQFAIFNYQ